jgi:hypothetical protein
MLATLMPRPYALRPRHDRQRILTTSTCWKPYLPPSVHLGGLDFSAARYAEPSQDQHGTELRP